MPLSLLAGIVAYAATATEHFPTIVLVVGAAGLVVTTVALAGGWPSILPVGLVGVGVAYAIFLAFRSESVDPWAPFVAAALFAGQAADAGQKVPLLIGALGLPVADTGKNRGE